MCWGTRSGHCPSVDVASPPRGRSASELGGAAAGVMVVGDESLAALPERCVFAALLARAAVPSPCGLTGATNVCIF